MLAKSLKIKNLKRQREFITGMIMNLINNPPRDGNTSFLYMGTIFPENWEYFKNEGFDILQLNFIEYTAEAKGMPIFRISVKSELTLDDEEMKLANNVNTGWKA